MTAITVFDPNSIFGLLGIFVLVLTALALGWSVFRSQGMTAWRNAAEGYKAQLDELHPRLDRAEQQATTMATRVAELESLPDLSRVVGAVRAEGEAIRAAVAEVKEAVDALASPRG